MTHYSGRRPGDLLNEDDYRCHDCNKKLDDTTRWWTKFSYEDQAARCHQCYIVSHIAYYERCMLGEPDKDFLSSSEEEKIQQCTSMIEYYRNLLRLHDKDYDSVPGDLCPVPVFYSGGMVHPPVYRFCGNSLPCVKHGSPKTADYMAERMKHCKAC